MIKISGDNSISDISNPTAIINPPNSSHTTLIIIGNIISNGTVNYSYLGWFASDPELAIPPLYSLALLPEMVLFVTVAVP